MIGVFDSGVGGLGVLAALRGLLPSADLFYVADHAAAPYGTRTLSEVEERSRLVASWLEKSGAGVVTLACNTASAAALHALRREKPGLTFVGMEPAVKPAAQSTTTGKVGVVATSATFQGELFASVLDRFASDVDVVTSACSGWVELVERGCLHGPEAEAEVRGCLQPMIDHGIDVLVLACTHYPALTDMISAVLGPTVRVIDPSPAVARQTARVAAEAGCDVGAGITRLASTGDPRALERAARRFGIESPAALLPLE